MTRAPTDSSKPYRATCHAGRQFSAKSKQDKPARQPKADGVGKFDLTPDDEQEMLIEAFGDFAQSELLPIATKSSNDCVTPPEVLKASTELGVTMIGVPEELGGAVEQRSAVTSVLISEALAKGDLGMAVAVLAPAAVVDGNDALQPLPQGNASAFYYLSLAGFFSLVVGSVVMLRRRLAQSRCCRISIC